MAKFNLKSSTLVFFMIWFFYIVFYGLLTTVIREDGYLNFEPLFITSHINTLFGNQELVKNFFLSYPLLTNVLSYPFSIFSAVDAPFFASIFYTSFFVTALVTSVGSKQNKVIKILLFLYFLCSPITFYAATSGTSVYAFYILYFLIFFYLFNYIIRFTTYHITILSIILSLAVFLDFRILWILLILFFHVFVFSIYGIKGLSSNVIIKYVKITQHISLRRKYVGHLNSMVFIIGFFPVVTLLLYLFINYLMGDDSFYFYNALGAKWNSNRELSLLNVDVLTTFNNKAVNDFSFLSIVLFITPIYVFELIMNYKRGLKIFILLSVPILLYVLLRDSQIEYMGLFYYVIIIASAIASVATSPHRYFSKKVPVYFSYACVFAISIYGEYSYLKASTFTSEHVYYKSVVEKEQNDVLSQYKNGGRFLELKTPKNSIVLCDRSIMYPMIAYNKKNNIFVSNVSADFKKALYNPKKYCDYVVISNDKSPFYYLDKVVINLREIENTALGYNNYRSKVVFVCDAFRIIKIIK
ncbi:hypothetical protein [Wenyingzhuangia aestuarii]|uniref:hypothetical protein n=1 Tax=Wenyingzhuangia aestuarii TaxID=1647582 RepID=UPI00143ACE8D|nr:hypothetical protein [Wenyingzhuangia aestuarii]NJB83016.1 hypothetical protein [Wenyingzhuangia aestuarii]